MVKLIHIGHSLKSRGVDGAFKANIQDPFRSIIPYVRAVFINLDGSKVPFLIEKSTDKGHIILKLFEVNSPEKVSGLLSKELYLDASEIPEELLAESEEKAHPLTGYTLIDQHENTIGVITELIEYPQQLLAKINLSDKELLVPIHQDLILDLNENLKELRLSVIDGLLDL